MNYTKHIIKHSLIYGGGESLIRLANFLLIPIYTRYLVPDEYGILQLLIITANLVAIVLELGIGSAIFKSILYSGHTNENATYSTAFYFTLLTSLIGILPLLMYRNELTTLIVGSDEHALALSLLVASIFFRNFAIIPFAKLRIEDRSVTYVVIAFVKFFIQIALNIYFVVVLGQGILGISMAQFISSFVLIFVFIYIIMGNLRLSFSRFILKDMLEFGLPLVPGALALFVINMSNRYFLKHYSSVEQVALFSLGYYVGLIINVLVFAFQRVWAAAMFKIAKEDDAHRIFAKNFTYFILVLSSVTFILSVFSWEIIGLMTTEKYYDSFRVVPFMCLSFLFYGVYFYMSYGMNIKKMTRYQPVIIGISAGLNLLLNFFLIPRYSMLGAAAANTISFALMGVLAGVVSNRFYTVRIELKRLLFMAFIFTILFLLGFTIHFDSTLLTLSYKLLLCVIALMAFLKTNFFTRDEKKIIRRVVFFRRGNA